MIIISVWPGVCDKYDTYSSCFDINFRCGVECGNYDLNFTGQVDGCKCDCGPAYVSICSGFAYEKEEYK